MNQDIEWAEGNADRVSAALQYLRQAVATLESHAFVGCRTATAVLEDINAAYALIRQVERVLVRRKRAPSLRGGKARGRSESHQS